MFPFLYSYGFFNATPGPKGNRDMTTTLSNTNRDGRSHSEPLAV